MSRALAIYVGFIVFGFAAAVAGVGIVLGAGPALIVLGIGSVAFGVLGVRTPVRVIR